MLGLTAALLLVAAPVVAQSGGVKVSRFPTPPAEPMGAGDMVVMVGIHDGARLRLVDGVAFQPQTLPVLCAPREGGV